MSATVFGTARHSIIDDDAATGLKLANLRYAYSTEESVGEDHTGSDFAFAVFNDQTEVTADGVVAVATTGLGLTLADVIVLANESDGGLSMNDDSLFSTADANAGVVLTSLDVSRTNRGFETGSLTGKFKPLVATNAPTTLT